MGLARLVAPAIVLVAVVLTTFRLSTIGEIYFDEVFYVAEARGLLDPDQATRVGRHPPVGTWLIAAGIALFGDQPIGWRLPGALAGGLTVGLLYLLVERLTRGRGPALLAAALLAVDGVFLTQARIAMLDIYLVLFVVAGAWLVVVDRQRRTAPRSDATPGGPGALIGAGVMLGLAVATKWSGLIALATVVLLAIGWEWAALRRRAAGRSASARAGVRVGIALGAVPVTVYALTWLPWMIDPIPPVPSPTAASPSADPVADEHRVRALVDHHRALIDFHLGLEPTHRYRSSSATWAVQSRPVLLTWERCDLDGFDRADQPCDQTGVGRRILGVGNPALWWTGLLSLPILAGAAARRDWRAVTVLALVLGQYLPWLVSGRLVFSFYALVLAPFVAAGVALATELIDAPRRWRGQLVGVGVGALVGIALAMLTGVAAGSRPSLETGVLLLVGATMVGAALGAVRDHRGEPAAPSDRSLGAVVRAVILVAAVGLAAYFGPLWFGSELELDAIRHRLWFAGWR